MSISSDTTKPIVSFKDVSIVFGSAPKTALPMIDEGRNRAEIQEATGQILGVAECSLDVMPGEIVVLMGLSGSGKSTLLRAVNGLNPVVRGSVDVAMDDDLGTYADPAKANRSTLRKLRQQRVAMVFQQFGLLPWRSVRDNVGFGLELSGMSKKARRERVDEQLELVGLSDRGDSMVGELSGGMQQRVGLARAFSTQAPILLMDEPFSALDPLIRDKLQDDLLELQERLKRTIIFVSHDFEEAIKLGNRIALMEGGRIIQTGTAQDICLNPATDYVAAFVEHMNPLSVLTSGTIATSIIGSDTPSGPSVAHDMPLGALMDRLLDSGGSLEVTKDDRVVGMVGMADVVAALNRR